MIDGGMEDITPPILPEGMGQMEQPEVQQVDPNQAILDSIDDNELSTYIMNTLRDDIRDREEYRWDERRAYDINSYEGHKRPTDFPWRNASNFPVPLTPTLVDTAHANVLGSIFADPEKVVTTKGVAKEDMRTAPILQDTLNWQLINDIKTFEVMDTTLFRAFKTGTGVVKIVQDPKEKKIVLESLACENIFININACGFQVCQKADHVFELVALSEGDLNDRKARNVYQNTDSLKKGFRIQNTSNIETLSQIRDQNAGTSVTSKMRRDMYYIMECYLTYWYKPKDAEPGDNTKQMVELIVWIAPNGGAILKKAVNILTDSSGYGVRPYALFRPYPYEDRFYGKSLPEKIRFIQEELDYAHNQNINAADIAISPPTFYAPTGDINPELNQIVPGGFYPTPTPRDVFVAERRVDPIFERQEDRYWDLAERLTGLTELFQGREPSRTSTLGEAQLRNNRSEIRFATLYKRLEKGFKEMIDLIYFYDQHFLDPNTKVKVTGTSEIMTIKELFPEGIQGKFDFYFSSPPLTEVERQRQLDMDFYTIASGSLIVAQSEASQYNLLKLVADATNHKNLDLYVSKPEGAYILTPEQAIQKIMSGDLDVAPDLNIDAQRYIHKINLFMRSDSFKRADPQQQMALAILLKRSENILEGQLKAKAMRDAIVQNMTRQTQAASAAAKQPVNGNGKEAAQ